MSFSLHHEPHISFLLLNPPSSSTFRHLYTSPTERRLTYTTTGKPLRRSAWKLKDNTKVDLTGNLQFYPSVSIVTLWQYLIFRFRHLLIYLFKTDYNLLSATVNLRREMSSVWVHSKVTCKYIHTYIR